MTCPPEDLKRTRQMLDLSQRRLSFGIDSQYQFQQTESLEATSRANLIDAEKRLQSAKIALAVLLGKGPDRGHEDRPAEHSQAWLPWRCRRCCRPSCWAVVRTWWPRAGGSRRRARSIDAGKTQFYPNLNLSAAAGTRIVAGRCDVRSRQPLLQCRPDRFRVPIFDGGRLRADLDSRDADYDLAVAQYNKSLVQSTGRGQRQHQPVA